MHAAALTENIDSHCSKDTENPHILLHSTSDASYWFRL